jgi:hypothetical protein
VCLQPTCSLVGKNDWSSSDFAHRITLSVPGAHPGQNVVQAGLQERALQHKQAVEESDRLRAELQRISDDRDQRATQV